MKRPRAHAVHAILVAATVLGVPTVATASPIDEQRDRVAYYADRLEQLEEQAETLAGELETAIVELAELEVEVEQAEAAVTAQEGTVAEMQELLSETVVRDFVGADPGSIGALFSDVRTASDQIRREQFSAAALNAGAVTSDDLNRELNDLTDKRAELTAARETAANKRTEVENAKKIAESKAGEYRDLKAAAETELGEMIAAEERRRAEESYRRMLAEQQAAADAAARQQATQNANAQRSGGNQQQAPAPQQPAPQQPAPQQPAPQQPAPQQPAPQQPAPPPASSRGQRAVDAALTQLGVPWKFATATPGVSFDCSGLTKWAWGQAGVRITHQSRAQYAETSRVPASQAQPGDLLFFYSPISHVGMYIGGGQMVHSPNSGSVVNIRSVNWGNVVGVGRPG